jgi:hypothetical protein
MIFFLSEVAAHINTSIRYRSDVTIVVGYGTDPWYGSEMGMKIKYSRRKKKTCTYNETGSIKHIMRHMHIFFYTKRIRKIGFSVFF